MYTQDIPVALDEVHVLFNARLANGLHSESAEAPRAVPVCLYTGGI